MCGGDNMGSSDRDLKELELGMVGYDRFQVSLKAYLIRKLSEEFYE